MIIRNTAGLEILTKQLLEYPLWAYDIETSGLNPRSNSITDIALYNGVQAYNIVLQEWNGTELVQIITAPELHEVLSILQTKKLRTHNGSFDARFTHHQLKTDLWLNIYEDSMLMAHTINENRFNYGLKELGAEIFGHNVTDEKQAMLDSIKSNGGGAKEFYKADSNLRAKYAMQDVQLTWRLCEFFQPELDRQNLREFYQTEVMELLRNVTIPMELYGIPVNVELLKTAQTEITEELNKLENSIQAAIKPHLGPFEAWFIRTKFPFAMSGEAKEVLAELIAPPLWPRYKTGSHSFAKLDVDRAVKKGLVDPNCELYRIYNKGRVSEELQSQVQLELMRRSGIKHPFNLSSKDHLKRLFFKKHGGPLNETALSFTEKGAPQVNDDFLSAMALKYPWAALLQDFNSLNKIKGSYIERILEEQEDGIFYPSFFQHRTVSGRYSGDAQQLPRPLEAGQASEVVIRFTNLVRRFFECKEDELFADFDYDSQEVKVFAHVSGDEGLKAIFAKGHDFYSTICIEAEKLEGYSADKKAPNYLGKLNKAARQRAKSYALGLAFGMTPYKLKFELNCSEREAEAIYNGYMTAYPQLAEWMQRSKKFACENGYITTEAGRVRRFPQLKAAYEKHGELLFDGLELWKAYNEKGKERPGDYATIKELASYCKNYVNNAYNVQIQGLAASITNRAAIKTAKQLKLAGINGYICNVTHDQITVRCKAADIDVVAPLLTEAMETAYPISVPLTAPPSWGKNFAESKG